jgi:small conductance mechanosensitive channel
VGQAVALLLSIAILLRMVRWVLHWAHRRVRSWERLTANDAAVDALFRLLARAVTIATWLATLAVLASWLPGSEQLSSVLLILLRIYLVFAVAMLLVRAAAAVVDSLDALSAKYIGPQTPFRFYSDVRTLVPLFRRCLELAIWLAAASIMMLQVGPVAPLATYGPRLIQVVGIFFVARVAAELVSLVVERTQGDRPGLTDLEKQQRATLIPLVTSLGRAAVYFVAGVLMLSVLGFNPIPLLAGAGILGVVIGFGAQPVINDLVSGFFISQKVSS